MGEQQEFKEVMWKGGEMMRKLIVVAMLLGLLSGCATASKECMTMAQSDTQGLKLCCCTIYKGNAPNQQGICCAWMKECGAGVTGCPCIWGM